MSIQTKSSKLHVPTSLIPEKTELTTDDITIDTDEACDTEADCEDEMCIEVNLEPKPKRAPRLK